MKVYELIAELMKYPAGDEVKVATPWTQYASINDVSQFDKGIVGIDSDDSEVMDEDGNEVGMLSDVVNGN